MDNHESPRPLNITDDSGFASGSINQTSFSIQYESTPNISLEPTHSRKRKFIHLLSATPAASTIASSTLNESSIACGLEKCNISNFTPNYYVEREDTFESPGKKPKSVPSTPLKEAQDESEFYRKHTDSYQKTPSKCASLQRLGSPECNEILYNGEIRLMSSLKLDPRKRHSPAKKQLFKVHADFERRRLPVKNDPVKFFCKDRELGHVMNRIISHLSDKDLCEFVWVCKDWKMTIKNNKSAHKRMVIYQQNMMCEKENRQRRSSTVRNSPEKSDSPYFMLKDNQYRTKCQRCFKSSAIVDKNISQCERYNCGYILCIRCGSFSLSGPENFHDSCQQSCLVIPKPRDTDSPKYDQQADSISFFLDPRDSSGYSTEYDESPATPKKRENKKRLSLILGDSNRESASERSQVRRRSSLVPVESLPTPKKREEIMEPSSPPKIKNIACSKSSKKSLKRLIRQLKRPMPIATCGASPPEPDNATVRDKINNFGIELRIFLPKLRLNSIEVDNGGWNPQSFSRFFQSLIAVAEYT